MTALQSFGMPVDVLGWDEAFLGADTDDPEALAREVQDRVRDATALECSVGIGQNTLQAKLATGFGKPAGVFRLTYDTWFAVLGDQPTDALWGIGRKLSKRLADVGITTVKELAAADPESLKAPFGPSTGPWLVSLGNGHGSRTITGTPYVARGKSREVTFQTDLDEWDEVRRQLALLCAAGRRRRGRRGTSGGPGRRQGPLRAVLHQHAQPEAGPAGRRRRRHHRRRARRTRAVHRPATGPADRRTRRAHAP